MMLVLGGEHIASNMMTPAMIALDAGIKSAREKPLVDLGSFAQYAGDDTEWLYRMPALMMF